LDLPATRLIHPARGEGNDSIVKANLPQVARITNIVSESDKVKTLRFDLSLEADPGQFVMVWLPGLDEKPFSLVQVDPVTVTIARVGHFSAAIHALKRGESLWLRGPLGRPFTLPSEPPSGSERRVLLIGGGYGVAPMHFLARRALAAGWGVTMIIGAGTAADVIFANRFELIGAEVSITTEDGSKGLQGLATEAAEQLLRRVSYQGLYACGPEAMLDAVERIGRSRELLTQLSYERYMRCAFGVCGSCAREGWLVCRDGPVREVSSTLEQRPPAPS
jgi:dihydroorotate dehydrogenase electron transfer subunit